MVKDRRGETIEDMGLIKRIIELTPPQNPTTGSTRATIPRIPHPDSPEGFVPLDQESRWGLWGLTLGGPQNKGQSGRKHYLKPAGTPAGTSSKTPTKSSWSLRGGAILNTMLSLRLFNFFINLIEMRVVNGHIYFLVPDNTSQKTINEFCIYNSINYLENIKDVKSIYNNTTSYKNINKYLEDSNISLTKFMSLNQSGKTIKNYRKKLKNTKKHKIKKHIKTKKKIFRYNKFTRKT